MPRNPADLALSQKALSVNQRLLNFFGNPTWRKPLPPLDELISTILSQNTNDVNRDRAFENLRARYPTWEEVRDAPVAEIVAAIRPAGLANQKGLRIQQILQEITQLRGDLDINFLADLPVEEARQWLMQFKGVGPKTSAIVLLFSLNKPAFPVDTHIYRVAGRLGLRSKNITADQTHDHLSALLPPDTYYAAHLNLIRLGREICQARQPLCHQCPLQDLCDFYQLTFANKVNNITPDS